MRPTTKRSLAIWTFCGFFLMFGVGLVASSTDAASPSTLKVHVDATRRGKTIGNKVSTVNLWQFQSFLPPVKEAGANLSEFVEYVQFMQATGGNESRDLFVDPKNFEVLDDYAFEPLIKACSIVLSLGAKPHIKLSVPDKLSKETDIDVFGVDTLPPDDYESYYRYIQALTTALIDRFGVDEVRSWGFGVLVEFENSSWFHDKVKSPEGSRDAFFKLYDYSVAALCEQLGDDIWVGAHAMACTEGLWDERDFLDHCANDVNCKTGRAPIPIKYFAVSFYDDAPDKPHPLTLVQTIDRVRNRANEVGLTNLRYGVDEGRILGATKGKVANDLTFRIVGQTYQAAYDARLFKIMIDSDIDYFSAWSYSTDLPWSGYPLVAYRVAQNVARFKNSKLLERNTDKKLLTDVDSDAVAGFDEESQTLYLMAYNFKFDLNYADSVDVEFDVNVPFWQGRNVRIRETIIDDEENFFCDWIVDKERLQIPDSAFTWSPDSGSLDIGWNDPEMRDLYFKELRSKYVEKANRPPRSNIRDIVVEDNGIITMSTTLARHAVVFYSVSLLDE